MARKKSTTVNAPQSEAEAILLLTRYAELQAHVSKVNAAEAQHISDVKAKASALREMLETEATALFKRLKPWWEANKSELTGDARKSIELGGCKIGIRTATPSLKLPKGMNEDGAVNWLRGLAKEHLWVEDLLRIKLSLDKPEILAVLRCEHRTLGTMVLSEKGFTVAQPEQFFIEPAVPTLPSVETVDVEQA
jgi:phage host-nuclease inhibitor protein Gam